MAQRLNTLLADLTVRPTAAMTTKDQLDQIFRAEIERMSAHLDDIAFAARRTGSTDDVREMEADIEVGWAYRLIQLFGTGRPLAFDEGCPGRSLLLRHGIPEPHIPLIAETFRAEQKEAASALFDRQVRQQMAEVGLPDTLANRERAKMELFRAKADALLDVGGRWPMIDRRQNALVASTLPEDERPSFRPDGVIDRNALEPVASGRSPPSGAPAIDRPETLEAPASQVVIASTTAIDPNEAAAPLPMVAAASSEKISNEPIASGASRKADTAPSADLPISKFDEAFERLLRNNRENWEPATASDVRALVRMFADVLDENGVRHSGEINQSHIAALRDHFNLIPPRYGQSPRLRLLKPAALRAFAIAEAERAERAGQPKPKVGLSAATIRKHLGNLDTFLEHLRASGYAVADWNLKGLRPKKPKIGMVRLKQQKPSPSQVRPIFDLPIFTGCRSAEHPGELGSLVFHSSLYYLPMLYTFFGARRNEMAGLRIEDVLSTDNGPAIHIRANELRRVKNAQSDRLLPVPDEVIRLGFLDYAQALARLGYVYLFPELYAPHHKTNDPGDRFYKDFMPILRASPTISETLWDRTIHALRHGFSDSPFALAQIWSCRSKMAASVRTKDLAASFAV